MKQAHGHALMADGLHASTPDGYLKGGYLRCRAALPANVLLHDRKTV